MDPMLRDPQLQGSARRLLGFLRRNRRTVRQPRHRFSQVAKSLQKDPWVGFLVRKLRGQDCLVYDARKEQQRWKLDLVPRQVCAIWPSPDRCLCRLYRLQDQAKRPFLGEQLLPEVQGQQKACLAGSTNAPV